MGHLMVRYQDYCLVMNQYNPLSNLKLKQPLNTHKGKTQQTPVPEPVSVEHVMLPVARLKLRESLQHQLPMVLRSHGQEFHVGLHEARLERDAFLEHSRRLLRAADFSGEEVFLSFGE